jgi:hypothetical protein
LWTSGTDPMTWLETGGTWLPWYPCMAWLWFMCGEGWARGWSGRWPECGSYIPAATDSIPGKCDRPSSYRGWAIKSRPAIPSISDCAMVSKIYLVSAQNADRTTWWEKVIQIPRCNQQRLLSSNPLGQLTIFPESTCFIHFTLDYTDWWTLQFFKVESVSVTRHQKRSIRNMFCLEKEIDFPIKTLIRIGELLAFTLNLYNVCQFSLESDLLAMLTLIKLHVMKILKMRSSDVVKTCGKRERGPCKSLHNFHTIPTLFAVIIAQFAVNRLSYRCKIFLPLHTKFLTVTEIFKMSQKSH